MLPPPSPVPPGRWLQALAVAGLVAGEPPEQGVGEHQLRHGLGLRQVARREEGSHGDGRQLQVRA